MIINSKIQKNKKYFNNFILDDDAYMHDEPGFFARYRVNKKRAGCAALISSPQKRISSLVCIGFP